jgi:hypothetical protein
LEVVLDWSGYKILARALVFCGGDCAGYNIVQFLGSEEKLKNNIRDDDLDLTPTSWSTEVRRHPHSPTQKDAS